MRNWYNTFSNWKKGIVGLIAIALLCGAAAPQVGGLVELQGYLYAKTSPDFRPGIENNIRTVLPPNTKGEIEKVITFYSGNYGLKVKVQNGPNTGEEVWIHFNPSKNYVKLCANHPSTSDTDGCKRPGTINDAQGMKTTAPVESINAKPKAPPTPPPVVAAAPAILQAPAPSNDAVVNQILKDLNRIAGASTPPSQNCVDAPGKPASITLLPTPQADAPPKKDIWTDYASFQRDFVRKYGRLVSSSPGYYKQVYLREMIGKFGQAETGDILAAVTGWGEAPMRKSSLGTIAEMAAVMRVIDNRAAVNYSAGRTVHVLENLGISGSQTNPKLREVLAPFQFSVWNEGDNSLIRMLTFNPDTQWMPDREKMRASFNAQDYMKSGRIQFLGDFGRPSVVNYHASYMTPSDWNFNRIVRIAHPTVRILADDIDGRDPASTGNGVDVDLSDTDDLTDQRYKSHHIFYYGR